MHTPVLAYLLISRHPSWPDSMLPAFQGKGLSEVRRRAPNQERQFIFKWLGPQFGEQQVGTQPVHIMSSHDKQRPGPPSLELISVNGQEILWTMEPIKVNEIHAASAHRPYRACLLQQPSHLENVNQLLLGVWVIEQMLLAPGHAWAKTQLNPSIMPPKHWNQNNSTDQNFEKKQQARLF